VESANKKRLYREGGRYVELTNKKGKRINKKEKKKGKKEYKKREREKEKEKTHVQ
jgi:hypothetical protein